jgi:integrase
MPKLTVKGIEAKSKGFHADGGGLYLKVTPTGTRSWVYRYFAGKRHDLGLGPWPDISLAEARDRAAVQRRLRLDGKDPMTERRAGRDQAALKAAKAMTFRECATRYIDAHKAGWRNVKHGAQWTATLETYAYPTFGKLPVAEIDTGLVMKVVEPIWTTKPETASRVRGRIESILDWATVSGHRQGDNPARWRGHLEALLPAKTKVRAVEHHAALPYAELGAFMADLRSREGLAARALEFAILTAARTGEVIGATWSEIDFKAATWTIPGDRMKAGREHRVALSGAALAVLKALAKGQPGDRVFPLSNMAMLQLLKRMERGDLTAHGFRSTFSDWCAEMTAFSSEVREMALAHAVGDKVEAAYRRGDLFAKRVQLAEAWAKFCAKVETPTGDNVQPMQKRA